ncbi:hypothetical protein D9619_013415 [Psilocybe cf. subviscida]|uniref:Transmembrane protein n=1 Tax=Psilocybe cf. subviscida TaxID=2480587 RepID=A0A8H5F976_9AGAR|nr:hypothetical protein D9619_013415 [Psilocybe cf. subviscida]
MHLPNSDFFTSSLIVNENAVKNILFRAATIVLDFAALRLFALIAFHSRDYTSFLMFAEDFIQRAMFAFSRGLGRQTLLVAAFAAVVTVVGFYDTLLWALDNPGFVYQQRAVSASSLASRKLPDPAYITLILADTANIAGNNNLHSTFFTSLYDGDLNFTLPGDIQAGGLPEVVAPLRTLGPAGDTVRVWLDNEGFAVGIDPTFMDTVHMMLSAETDCYPSNPVGEKVTQTWKCNVGTIDGLDVFANDLGRPKIWWDLEDSEFLQPERADNPWNSLGNGGGTALMKQVFTVTKGLRRHTFLETVFKANMLAFPPYTLADSEITDFMRRTWSTNDTLTPDVAALVKFVVDAKKNQTGITFGAFSQYGTSLLSSSTDYLQVAGPASSGSVNFSDIVYTALRFSSTNITLIRSETLLVEPEPLSPCPGAVYRNLATSGIVRSTNCNILSGENQTTTTSEGKFLGQIDTSAVALITNFLGDGSSNVSTAALSPAGTAWLEQENDRIDRLLLSRALIVGGTSDDVVVLINYTRAAISKFQLVLIVVPVALALLMWALTQRKVMSYFKNSFLAAVLATTHTSTSPCDDLGYVRTPPEITLQRNGAHVVLGTPNGGVISNSGSAPQGLLYQPLILDKDGMQTPGSA